MELRFQLPDSSLILCSMVLVYTKERVVKLHFISSILIKYIYIYFFQIKVTKKQGMLLINSLFELY